ncbi:MAG: anhydro-N-acetylmuramic acid kinase [Acidobacteria bacterium]|nr:MAG: anhydro-N-acetylmuramic acid kinase [Acidobacteriota bacterium]
MRVAGVMSGTSLDGIDVAIVDIRGHRIKTVAFNSSPYPESVRQEILSVSNATTTTASIARLHFLLGELYAAAIIAACRRHRIALHGIELVGCHGQTIYHQGEPEPYLGCSIATTLQIGEAGVIAERIAAPVISDFRTRDVAAGGKGAPLVPYVDYLLFRHQRLGRVALNIGGIANVTALPPGASSSQVIAFDTGPGNMIIDGLATEVTRGREHFDRDGRIAARGRPASQLLDRLLADPYYRRKPPKTAGREQYGAKFIGLMKRSGLGLRDLMATATAFTAVTIAVGVERFIKPRMPVDELIVSGGGVHNRTMMGYLSSFLPSVRITTSEEFGVGVDAKEGVAFALLAYETWCGRAANLPSATGAHRPVILGKITQ